LKRQLKAPFFIIACCLLVTCASKKITDMQDSTHPQKYYISVNGSKQIKRVATSVTAFVGKATKGPIGKAELIRSFNDYKLIYGDIASENDNMGMAVQSFYLNGGKSAYICRLAGENSEPPSAYICRLAGENSEPPSANDFTNFYDSTLGEIRDVSIIIVPGEHWAKDGSGNPIISVTLAHCEKMQDRMVIIDFPPDFELDQVTSVTGLALPSSAYSVLYYPWVKVANPFYNAETNTNADTTVTIAPSSFAAGIWSRIDNKRGVWKAPAGMDAGLIGTAGLEYIIEEGEQDQLNILGVNCIRNMPGTGRVIWGARTLANETDPEWRYVPVQRTAIMIKQSIYEGTQWAVFEPNDSQLWSTLRGNIGSFMNSLFRAGAFQGAKASDAYFVKCGLGTTMTQADIDAGQVIIIVGFAALRPAEFTIIRIKQKVRS